MKQYEKIRRIRGRPYTCPTCRNVPLSWSPQAVAADHANTLLYSCPHCGTEAIWDQSDHTFWLYIDTSVWYGPGILR